MVDKLSFKVYKILLSCILIRKVEVQSLGNSQARSKLFSNKIEKVTIFLIGEFTSTKFENFFVLLGLAHWQEQPHFKICFKKRWQFLKKSAEGFHCYTKNYIAFIT